MIRGAINIPWRDLRKSRNNKVFTPAYLVALIILAGVYFGAAKLGLRLAFHAEQVTAVWPPTGLALAATLVFGYRVWPGILVGAFFANVTSREPGLVAAGIAVGNTLEALVGAYLVRRFAGPGPILGRIRGVVGLITVAAIAATALAATVGVSSLCIGGIKPWSSYGPLWWLWWIGDATGALIFTPVLLAWAGGRRLALSARSVVEAAVLFAGLLAVGFAVFLSGPWALGPSGYSLVYAVFPFVIWAAMRFGQRGTTTAVAAASCVAIWGTVHGAGPFALGDIDEGLKLLQVFMATVAISGVLLAAALAERDAAERRRAVDYAVTRIFSQATTLTGAMPRILWTICESLAWDTGALWRVDEPAGLLRFVELWHTPRHAVPGFEAASRGRTFERGIGLPGRSWASREPAWIGDVAGDANFPRAAVASQEGLHTAFAFPILRGAEVVAVMEFFSREIRHPDKLLLGVFASIGGQIGLFMERLRTEEASRRSDLLHRALLESALDCVIGMDQDGAVLEFNPAAEKVFGVSRAEALGKPLAELIVPPRLREQHRAGLARFLGGGEARVLGRRIEIAALRGDGTEIPVELSITVSEIEGRKVFTGYVRDITERKRAEDAFRKLNETLESQVAQRTALAEKRSSQLQALAAELTQTEHRERRRLAQLLHDGLQQLLVAAKMQLELAGRRIKDPESMEMLQEVRGLLIESIDASRSITVELSPPVLYDASLAVGLEWLVRHKKEKYGLDVTVDLQTVLEPADERMRTLVFESVRELLFNVVKHAGVKTAKVSVTADGRELKIVVADDGNGCSNGGTRLPEASSGGFGLFSIRERVQLMGGRFTFESAAGQGTRVALKVPAVSASSRAAPAGVGSVRSGASRARDIQSAQNPGPLTVLIADDHQILREGIAQLLETQADLEIVGLAGDGLEAVEMATRLRPNIILMDVTMPGLGGIEATRRIITELPDTKIIGVSMHDEVDMAAAMREAGAVGYLSKAGSLDTLIATIRALTRVDSA